MNTSAEHYLSEFCKPGLRTIRSMLLNAASPGRSELEQFVRSGGWAVRSRCRRIPSTNRKYRIYSISSPLSQGELVLKQCYINSSYPRLRQFELKARLALHDYSFHAYRAALALRKAGLPSVEPLACWKAGGVVVPEASFLLYKKVPAAGTVKDFYLRWRQAEFDSPAGQLLAGILKEVGRTARILHAAGFEHRDFTLNNLLITFAESPDFVAPDPETAFQLTIIDLERLRLFAGRQPSEDLVQNLQGLKRVEAKDRWQIFILRGYCEGDPPADLPSRFANLCQR